MFGKKRSKIPSRGRLCASYARRVYHATPFYFSQPDTKHSKKSVDFGPGFYTTPDREYAGRHMRNNKRKKKFVTIGYIFDDDAAREDNLKILEFKLDEEWLDFIMWNRTGKSDHIWPEYDIAIGPSADDYIKRVVDWYASCIKRGIYINPEMVIKMLKPECASQQILFHTDRSLKYLEEFEHVPS